MSIRAAAMDAAAAAIAAAAQTFTARMLRGRQKANWRKKIKEAGKGEGGGEI